MFGWKTGKKLSPTCKPYKNQKVELTIDQGCLIWGIVLHYQKRYNRTC